MIIRLNSFILLLSINLIWLVPNQTIGQRQKPEEQTLILNQALINKDEVILDKLLHDKLSYGHSNLWIETKKELLENNKQEVLKYYSIKNETIESIYFGKVCILRYNAVLNINYKGKDLELKLHVIQTWQKRHHRWQLIARQSVKL